MKKLLILPIVLFLATATVAQNSEKTGALLWRISGNNLAQPSYVFGTHHLFPLSFLETVSGLNSALENTQQVVGELVMGDDMMAMAMQMQSMGMMPHDTTWDMLLSSEDFAFVDEQLAAFFGAGLQAFGVLRPFMINLTFVAALYQQLFPETDPEQSMDGWFQQQAIERGLPVIGLESVEDQMNAIGVGSLVQQAEDFVCALRNIDYAINQAHELNRLYETADLIGLKGMLRAESPCAFSAEQEYALNNARNARWLEKLPGIMAETPSFIAVGALHLVGEVGILYGLAQLGFTVEAVK